MFLNFSILYFTPSSYGQINGEPISFSSNLEFNEYSEVEGLKSNASGINIQLPEENWTVTDININFNDIELGKEIKTIEDTSTDQIPVINKNPSIRTFALATQLEILEPTEIFGIFIRGQKTPQANETIKFQIQGFTEGTHNPNNTILRSIDLNISLNLDWYYQDFSLDPIILSIGNYSLVMNGTNLPVNVDAKYYWQIDNFNPTIPYLHTSSYQTSWSTGVFNSSFLYKIHQKVVGNFFPSDLNMTAEIKGENYEITDGLSVGIGFLKIIDHIFFQEAVTLVLPLIINRTAPLQFNYNYSVKLRNSFITNNNAKIEESQVLWTMEPIFNRVTQNYSLQFEIPRNWYNINIYRNMENVTSLVNFNIFNRIITIPNGTIEAGAEWQIKAYSPIIDLDIDITKTKWMRGDELEYSFTPPPTQGNYTFIIIKQSKKPELIPPEDCFSPPNFFSYEIPSNWTEGKYIAEVFWNNHTDIGMSSKDFKISVPFTIEPWMVILIVIGTLGIVTVGLISYRYVKKFRDVQLEKKQKLYDSCIDILNLEYLMVTDKKSGLNVYTQNFSEEEIDAALISGFLQAIHSFGIELIKVEDQSQTIKLEYRERIILMTEFVNIRLILIMHETPSRFFLYSIEELAYNIYKNFGENIDSFNGDVKPFQSIEALLKQNLNITFIYPMKIAKIEKLAKLKVTQNEREFINKAVSLMKMNNRDNFLIKALLSEKECNPKDVEALLDLIEKKIFLLI